MTPDLINEGIFLLQLHIFSMTMYVIALYGLHLQNSAKMKGWTEGPKFVFANFFHHLFKLCNTNVRSLAIWMNIEQPEP